MSKWSGLRELVQLLRRGSRLEEELTTPNALLVGNDDRGAVRQFVFPIPSQAIAEVRPNQLLDRSLLPSLSLGKNPVARESCCP